MNWKYKAVTQRVFSKIPLGEHLNYFAQRYVTRNLPISDATFAQTVGIAMKHLDAVRRHLPRPVEMATFYEFGAGWDMAIPLSLSALGVQRQILVDIRRGVRPELVNDVIQQFQRVAIGVYPPSKPDRLLPKGASFLPSLKTTYGIDYRAPCDARDTGLEAKSIDCITSTSTLEHIPSWDIPAILQECYRLLRDDGIMSFHIDYDDHYSYFDSNISKYNFLTFSDQQWTNYSPTLHYQNRLRHKDYLNLFRSAGFDIVEQQTTDSTASDLETLETLWLDERFKVYTNAQLAVHNALTVLRKRSLRSDWN